MEALIPGKGDPLDERNKAKEEQAENSCNNDSGKYKHNHMSIVGCLHINTEPLISSDILTKDGAGHAISSRNTQTREERRHRPRQANMPEDLPARCTHATHQP